MLGTNTSLIVEITGTYSSTRTLEALELLQSYCGQAALNNITPPAHLIERICSWTRQQ